MKIRIATATALGCALLYFFASTSAVVVSADTVPVSSSSVSSMPSATSTTSTSLPAVMPAAHSFGPNSFLTISDVPRQWNNWLACQYETQTYCYEPLKIIDSSGNEQPAQWSLIPSTNCHGNGSPSSYNPEVINPLCDLTGAHWMEVGVRGTFTKADLANTYRWKLRTGKIEPSVLMLGDTQKTVVGGDTTTGWTLEIWAKPAVKAYLHGCFTAETCPKTSVASHSEVALAGYSRMLSIESYSQSGVSVPTVELRNALRGTFIATNGVSQSWRFSLDTFLVTAVSPHFLPPDSSGKSEITPGFVRVFLPKAYITFDRGYKSLSLVTSERVKLTVSGEKATAKVTAMDHGILVDTGVTHFSAPNPEMMVLKADESAVNLPTSMSPTVSLPTASKTPATSITTLKKGKSKTLSSIAKPKASQRPKWTASGACRISGTRVVASKKSGTCKVTVRVLNTKKKYVVLKTVSYKVS
jgi:hypothetical protein